VKIKPKFCRDSDVTRKPSYRNDDRAMRPIYRVCALKSFGNPSAPMATFFEIFNGLSFRSIL